MNKLDLFESIIKEQVSKHEMPYDPSQWSKLNARLPKSGGGSGYGMLAAGLSSALIIGSLCLFGGSINDVEIDHNSSYTAVAQSPSNLTEDSKELVANKVDSHVEETTDNLEAEARSDENLPIKHIAKMKSNTIKVYSQESAEEVVINLESIPTDHEIKLDDVRDNLGESLPADSKDSKEVQAFLPLPGTAIACTGEKIPFEILNYSSKQSVQWDFGDGYVSSGRNPEHAYENEGRYTVSLTTARIDNPSKTKTITTEVVVNKSPQAKLEYVTSDNASRPITNFKVSTQDQADFVWDLGNGQMEKGKTPSTIYMHKGNYDVVVNVQGKNGCSTELTTNVYIDQEYNLLAPNGFTCDGNGTNDAWFPAALEELGYPFDLRIYNRAGKMVYNTNGIKPWNGVDIKTGENCQAGFYIWHVILTNEKGQKEEYQGHISLMR